MALTGEKIKGKDMAKCGIATNFVKSEKLEVLKSILIEKSNEDISLEGLKELVNEFSDIVYSPQNFYFPKKDEISRTFMVDDLDQIFKRLHHLTQDGSEGEMLWATNTIKLLNNLSPLSLTVTFEQIKRGIEIGSLEEAFNLEAQMISAYFFLI